MLVSHGTRASLAIPFHAIASAVGAKDGWRVTDVRGDEHHVDNISWQLFMETTPLSTVPALPGTYLVSIGSEDDGTTVVIRKTIVGWATCLDLVVRPISLDPEAANVASTYVLFPDGRVERSGSIEEWASLDEWHRAVGNPAG